MAAARRAACPSCADERTHGASEEKGLTTESRLLAVVSSLLSGMMLHRCSFFLRPFLGTSTLAMSFTHATTRQQEALGASATHGGRYRGTYILHNECASDFIAMVRTFAAA